MKDKEIGDIWRESNDTEKRPYGTTGKEIVQNLIRKLVEERRAPSRCEHEREENLRAACESFGIPWEQFKAGEKTVT